MLDTQSRQYSWQWEGWHCSKISSFFAHYKYEASSTWTYTMCFQVLFRRMARYMGLLRGNQTSFYLSHGWHCQYRSPDAKVFCSKVLSDRPFLYSHPLQRKRHASHQHLVREGLREFCHGYWLQPDRWRHDRIMSGNFRHSKRQTTEQNRPKLLQWKRNSIIKAVCPVVDYSLYVDDLLICYRSKHIHIIERHLQRSLNKLQEWADTNGFKFSTAKTVCVHFCRLRKFHSDPQLLLNGSPIPVVEEVKFLGIIFDKKTLISSSLALLEK